MVAGVQLPASSADRWVLEGFAKHRAGDVAAAEAAFRKALQLAPLHPDALQLLGLLLGAAGQAAAAEDLMRRSLQARPGQPHVWNNLGNLLLRNGRLPEALVAFDRALALAPHHADAHFNRACLLHAQGELAAAAWALDEALAHSAAPSPAMLQLQAQIQSDCGRADLALATLDRALASTPDRPALLHNRAVLLQQNHRYAEALRDHELALGLGLNAADAHYNHGNTLQSLGRLDEALAAYRRALAIEPCHRLALLDLSRLRWRRGDVDFDAELLQASAADNHSAVGPGVRGHLFWRAERMADAAQAYAEALRREPNNASFHDGLARCLVRLHETQAGLAAHARALVLAPDRVELHVNQAASLLFAGQIQAAADAAMRACELMPHHQHALALLGLAWRLQDDPREPWLNDHGRFVRVVDLDPPDGFASMADFNAALALELRRLHVDRNAPVDQTLRHGTQTLGDILDQGHPLVRALKARLAQAVTAYVAALPADPAHPFLQRRSAAWRFADSWSSRLHQRGFHTNHVHPHGWVSSAYYVSVPACCSDPARQEGWLQFGQPDIRIGPSDTPWLWLQPRPGRLVLFPSMFWHGTSPFVQDAERLTIAFDVVPA